MNFVNTICMVIVSLGIVAFACYPVGSSQQVRLGYDTYVCLTIAPLVWRSNGSFARMSSVVKADNFSSINIQRSWTSQSYANDTALRRFKINETVGHGLGIAVESMGILSYQRAYRQVISTGNKTSTSVTYPLMMAVIHVTKGKVTSINWDDNSCVWCTSKPSRCGQNVYDYNGVLQTSAGSACWMPDTQCAVPFVKNSNSTATSLCELTVYLTWTGTDSHGLYFKSAASRFSRMSSTQLTEFTSGLQATPANDYII